MSPSTVASTITVLAALTAATAAGAQTVQPLDARITKPAGFTIWAIAHQPDGKMLIGGIFGELGSGCGATPCPRAQRQLARLNQDGSLDVAFNPSLDMPTIQAIAVQSDGRILVAGGAGTVSRSLARLNADGSLDASFGPAPNGDVSAVLVQPDGRILIGGSFTMLGGTSRRFIARLNENGTIDNAFDPGANGSVHALARQPDGRILVGGFFTMLGGGGSGSTPRTLIGRLDANGIPDSFNPNIAGPFTPIVTDIEIQSDGQILVGGRFSTVNGSSRWSLARFTAAGVLDTTFAPFLGGPFEDLQTVDSIELQTDGRIVICGAIEGMGPFVRVGIGRLNANGSTDASFAIVLDAYAHEAAIDLDGRVVVGGTFNIAEGSPRNALARYTNTGPATHTVAVTGGGTLVTWLRGGTSAELERVTFEATTDGVSWTLLGDGTRVAGGWELGGQSIAAAAVVRARGFNHGSMLEDVFLPAGVNFVQNGGFTAGTTRWLQFATPDPSYIVSQLTNGVFEFYRQAPPPGTLNQAVVFQPTGVPVPSGTTLLIQFDLSNSSTERKRVGVLFHDADFGDSAVCTLWIEPGSPLRTYTMTTHTSQIVADATISFYAASIGSDGGFYGLDNVSMQVAGAPAPTETVCDDPTVPAPPGGAAGPNLLVNGDFSSGSVSPGWYTFGQITGGVTAGVFEFVKVNGSPAGVLVQDTLTPIPTRQILTATFDLGNSSPGRKRVTVVVNDRNFSDLFACTFWIPGGVPLQTYEIRGWTSRAWTSAMLSIYPATVGPDPWIRFDNAVLQQAPGVTATGIACLEPGSSAMAPPSPAGTLTFSAGRSVAAPVAAHRDPDAIAVLDFATSRNLWLRIPPRLVPEHARVLVQVSRDGVIWDTVQIIESTTDWRSIYLDVEETPHTRLRVRFVLTRQ